MDIQRSCVLSVDREPKRLSWCMENEANDFQNVIWTDETKTTDTIATENVERSHDLNLHVGTYM